MNISKLKAIIKYATGGIAGVIEYLLDCFNDMIQKLPREEVSKYAQLAEDISLFVANVADTLITNEAKKEAAKKTAKAVEALSLAMLDATITKDELDEIIERIKDAIEAWKAAK